MLSFLSPVKNRPDGLYYISHLADGQGLTLLLYFICGCSVRGEFQNRTITRNRFCCATPEFERVWYE